MTDRRRTNQRPYWIDSDSDSERTAPDELPAPSFLPRLSKLRGIRPAVPGPVLPALDGPSVPADQETTDSDVPPHIEVDALKTILERHVTGADGICFCGERAGEFTGRCRTGRKAAKQLTALGFMGYEVSAPPGRLTPRDDD